MHEDHRIWSFSHPDDVLASRLSLEEKRAVLADWASDEHAVENVPSMRQLDSGAIVPFEAVLAALRELDRTPADILTGPVGRRRTAKNRSGACRLGARMGARSNPDDDNPKPGGAGARVPPPPVRTNAVATTRLGMQKVLKQTYRLRQRRAAAYRDLNQGT